METIALGQDLCKSTLVIKALRVAQRKNHPAERSKAISRELLKERTSEGRKRIMTLSLLPTDLLLLFSYFINRVYVSVTIVFSLKTTDT